MCQFQFCLPVAISVSRSLFLFCFVGPFFLRLSLMRILALLITLRVLFITLRVPFTAERFCWGLVRRSFSTFSSLMSFTPFSVFSFCLVASFSGCFFSFFFSVLFFWVVVGLLSLFRVRLLFLFLLVRLPPSSFLTGSVLTSLLSLDPFTV